MKARYRKLATRASRRPARTALTVTAVAAALIATPQLASAVGDDDNPIRTGGPAGKDPAAAQLERDNAAVAAGPLSFGAEPLAAVKAAAKTAAADASCDVSAKEATALTLAPTWPEVAAGSTDAPSPMTLSRYDNQDSLYDPKGREGLFFNPGVGMWQLDSAGLGAKDTAATAIDSTAAAKKMAPYMVNKYCDSLDGGASKANARAHAWTDWHACDNGDCEDTFTRALEEVKAVDGVKRHGGASARDCTYEGSKYDCLFVDPGKAQGADWWAQPGGGQSPVPKPFYVFTFERDSKTYEVRYWLSADSDASADVSVSRQLGTDARSELFWTDDSGLCDTTENRGDC